MIRPRHSLLFICAAMFGCAPHQDDARPVLTSPYVRGAAKIISLDPGQGFAVLEFQGRHVNAYWKMETYLAQGGVMVRNDPLKPPVGQYAEPIPQTQTIQAKPGDTIWIAGLSTPSGILLRSVTVPE